MSRLQAKTSGVIYRIKRKGQDISAFSKESSREVAEKYIAWCVRRKIQPTETWFPYYQPVENANYSNQKSLISKNSSDYRTSR